MMVKMDGDGEIGVEKIAYIISCLRQSHRVLENCFSSGISPHTFVKMPIGGGDSSPVFVHYAKSKKFFKKLLTFRFCSVRMGTETERTTGAKPIEKIFSKSFEKPLDILF